MALTKWPVASVTANTDTDLISVTSGKTAMVLGLVVANYSGSSATIKAWVTDSSNTLKGYIIAPSVLGDGSSIHIDTKLVLTSTDKIRVWSDQGNVSFYASGDES